MRHITITIKDKTISEVYSLILSTVKCITGGEVKHPKDFDGEVIISVGNEDWYYDKFHTDFASIKDPSEITSVCFKPDDPSSLKIETSC